MCLCCVEYIKGNLTTKEFVQNKREFTNTEHDELAERVSEFAIEMGMLDSKVTIVKE
jgi:hypothetical protein